MGKNTTLISTPLIGLFIFIGTLATRNADEGETGELLGLAVMLIFLASHIAAVRRAAR
jgi:hypothetical protein